MKLAELAELTGASIEIYSSDAASSSNLDITGAAGLDDATQGQITFLANPRYTPRVRTTKASAIYLGEKVEVERNDIAVLRARDPYLAYTKALRLFHLESSIAPSIHPTAVIDQTAQIEEGVWIGPCVVIGPRSRISAGARIYPNVTIYEDVTIGKDSVIHAGVVIRERSQIGDRVIIHNNVVVGCDGFGYAKDEERHWLKIPQTGRVVIEDDVEIGAGTAIDRASVGESRIGRGTKVDNLVQIGHSCTVGEDTLLCGQVGLAGSTNVGNRVILAGQVGVAGHLTIGDDTVITSQSGVPSDVGAGKLMSGYPAIENREWLRSSAVFRRLGEMQRTVRELVRRISDLEKENDRLKHTKQ